MFDTDVVIVGAGPAGLFAVFECGMLKLKCHVVDALESIGGQCVALYPEKPIFDIPAYPRIDAAELIERLHEQAAPFAPVYHLNQQVTGLTRTEDGFTLTTSAGATIRCRAVIVAGGSGAFGPNRPPLDGLAAFENQSVFYLVKKRQDFAGKRVVIAGGGDSAVDWAVSLAEVAAHVMVVHRRDKFRAAPDSIRRMHDLAAAGKIEMVVPYQLAGLKGADGQLTGVTVATLDGAKRVLQADRLLPFFGLAMELGPIADWGLDLAGGHITVDPATTATNIQGVFAIGDMAAYPGKLKLILTGFAEAAIAAHSAFAAVHPGEALHFEYSDEQRRDGCGRMIDAFQHLIDSLGYFGVFLLLFIENIFPPLPSELVAPFCGYAAARGELNIAGVIAAAVLGSMVGQMPWYYAGRVLGKKRVVNLAARYGRWLTVTPHEVARVFAWFDRYGAASVFFGRMVPAIRAVISLPAGIANMPLIKFLAYSLAGTTIWMGGLAYAGYRLGQNYALVEKYMGPGTKIVAGLVVLVYVVRLGLSFRKPRARS